MWVKELPAMARSVFDAPQFTDEASAFAHVEERLWPTGPVCPFCGERERIGALKGKTTRIGLRKCYACSKPFTVRMGTIFESSHLPLHLWLQVIHLMCASKKGVSTRQVQRMLQCSMKTAWFLTHRIREAMAAKHDLFTPPLGGAGKDIEADEAFLARDPSKTTKGPGPSFPVMALVERGGAVRSFHVPNVEANTLRSVMARHADPQSRLMTDGAQAYRGIGWNFADHAWVDHSRGEYVSKQDPTIHSNTVEGYFSILKRGIYGVYHHVSEAHLHRYLAEFDYRYNTREKLGVDDTDRASFVIGRAKGKRLTYRTTRSAGQTPAREPAAPATWDGWEPA
jgi:transposase-like protein